ncbi:condensation domain-containing protein, partial [Acrocarpospora sp. B8E8]|uniref:condensation domain-containing protein n=1 Tax=Acrocarpospora sp. B8E8 TaxID=3153572 RepID=UPI00325DFA30
MARVAASRPTIPRRDPDTPIPLTPAQERLWFLAKAAQDHDLAADLAKAAQSHDTPIPLIPTHLAKAVQNHDTAISLTPSHIAKTADNRDIPSPLIPADLAKTAQNHDTYLCWAAHRLTGPLDPGRLAESLDKVVTRHEALRTFIIEVDGRPTQRVHAEVDSVLEYADLVVFDRLSSAASECGEAGRSDADVAPVRRDVGTGMAGGVWSGRDAVDGRVAEFLGRGFDLGAGPLIRALLVKTGADDYVFVLCLHHLVSDGETVGVIFGEVYSLYRGEILPEVKIQFPDYAVWAAGRRDTAADYWRRELEGAPGFLPLPTDRIRPSRASYRGDRCSVPLPEKVVEGIRRADATPFMVMMAALAVVLTRLADVDDVVVGSPVSDRDHPDLDESVGFYVNTLAFRTRLGGNPALGDVLAQVRETTMAGLDHRSVPFDEVVDLVGGRRALRHNPIFQVMLVTGEAGAVQHPAPGLTAESWALSAPPARFDLTVVAEATHLHFDYATDLFDANTMTRFGDHLIRVLDALTTTPDTRMWDVPLATIAPNPVPAGQALRVTDLIAARAKAAPDAPAVITETETTTYAELVRQADRLSQALRTLDPHPGSVVGVLLPSSSDAIAAILGVLNAGCAYLPLDPT